MAETTIRKKDGESDRCLLFKERVDLATLTCELSLDSMTAWLTIEAESGVSLAVDEVEALLHEKEISYGIDKAALTTLLNRGNQGGGPYDAVVARGTPVRQGKDGYIEYQKYPTGNEYRKLRSRLNVDESVDYKEIPAFDNVVAGDAIGRHCRPEEGQGGVDVRGRVNPCRQVSDIRIKAGNGVVFDPATCEYTATASGHLQLRNEVLSIEDVYVVKENVDLSHGNIRFLGRVSVGKDVQDDFVVEAANGISVGGSADCCRLKSGTDIDIRGGVLGKEHGKVEAQGNIFAKFLNDVEVIAGGDVVVKKEIINCRVYALGRVLIPKGVVVGGEIVALKGIVVGEIGSELGVKTRLAAGLDFKVASKLFSLHAALMEGQNRLEAMLQKLGGELERALKASAISNDKRDQMRDAWRSLRDLKKRLEALEAESGELCASFSDLAVARIEVGKVANPGTTFVTGKYHKMIFDPLKGPFVMEADDGAHRVQMSAGCPGDSLERPSTPPPVWEAKAGSGEGGS